MNRNLHKKNNLHEAHLAELVPWRRRPFWQASTHDLDEMTNDTKKIMCLPFSRWPGIRDSLFPGVWKPAVDITSSKDALHVEADIPGMKNDELEIYLRGSTLAIRGKKKRESRSEGKDYVSLERFYGSFSRTIVLPAQIDASRSKATYKNGVLELVLSKKKGAGPKKFIKIGIKQ
jgi:HSP20 family protein